MRSIPALLLTWYAASQDVYDNRTVLSVFYEGSMIDVRTLPDLLAHAGVERDDRITSFFNNTHIKTLRYAECQIAVTSMDSVSNVDLCDYIHEAKRHLPGLVTTCGKNINGKLTQLDDELYVNDPAARMEAQLVRMRMAEVWETLQKYARTNITVAVIDQGVDFVDPDMKPLMCSLNTSDGRTIKGGWNFVDDCALPTVESGHGQYVSRVLAARGNDSYGMVGVAADHVRLVPLQACRGGDCPIVHLVEAIDLAMDLGVDVISMSLRYFINGYSSGERSLLETVLRKAQEQNIILVSAAGNDKSDATDCYPCWYGGPNAICVAALSNNVSYDLAAFSNFGNRVDIAAFGEKVFVGIDTFGNLKWSSGTSFSAPIVSAAVAILLSLGVEPSMVKRILLADADRFQSIGRPLRPGGGALNLLASVRRAISMYNLRPIDDPRRLRLQA